MKPNNHVCGVGVAYGAKIGMNFFFFRKTFFKTFFKKKNRWYKNA